MSGKFESDYSAVRSAKAVYDKQVEQLEADLRAQKKLLKGPVLAAINQALSHGASQNSIAIVGMGYKGLSPMNTFINGAPMGITAQKAAPVSASAPVVQHVATYFFEEDDKLGDGQFYRIIGPGIPERRAPKVFVKDGAVERGNVSMLKGYPKEGWDFATMRRDFTAFTEGKISFDLPD